MYIKRIYLENYRNYSKEEFLPEIGLNFIFGKNGQGKTNLIETVYLLSSGKSFRNNNLRELINFDKSYFKVEIDYVYEENIESEIKYFFSLSGKKKVKIDGTEIEKNSDLMENLLVVIFSPEDLKIVKEDPEKRRKFLDREICQINKLYYMNLLNYNKVLKQRNFYLRENKINKSFLDILDEQIINFGKEIIEEREKYLKLLNEESKKINKKITYGREELEIIYLPVHVIDPDLGLQTVGAQKARDRGHCMVLAVADLRMSVNIAEESHDLMKLTTDFIDNFILIKIYDIVSVIISSI